MLPVLTASAIPVMKCIHRTCSVDSDALADVADAAVVLVIVVVDVIFLSSHL